MAVYIQTQYMQYYIKNYVSNDFIYVYTFYYYVMLALSWHLLIVEIERTRLDYSHNNNNGDDIYILFIFTATRRMRRDRLNVIFMALCFRCSNRPDACHATQHNIFHVHSLRSRVTEMIRSSAERTTATPLAERNFEGGSYYHHFCMITKFFYYDYYYCYHYCIYGSIGCV